MRWLALPLWLLIVSGAARAGEPVDLMLVLVTDVSRSIDDTDSPSRRRATRAAFTDRGVIAAIQSGPVGAIAVAYMEFASAY